MMIESAHRLLAGERTAAAVPLPSAHSVSLGQSVRGATVRFLLTAGIKRQLERLGVGEACEVGLVEKVHAAALTATLSDIAGEPAERAWPAGTLEYAKRGYAVRLPPQVLVPATKLEEVVRLLERLGKSDICSELRNETKNVEVILVSDKEIAHFYTVGEIGDRSFGRSRNLEVSSGRRLPESYDQLGEKRVGIVGCGSLGSKIAAMLVRAGIVRFTLVDDDVLTAANLVRNELGVPAIGAHKVDGVKARLADIAGTLDVVVRRIALGGQESADATDLAMADLQSCDVIVDATADPHCFNFCAAVAKAASKPMVWGKVYAGGIGGLVARVRPHFEPEPLLARNQIDAWCEQHEVPAPIASHVYELPQDGQPPLIADDAEVSIIAGHIARFVLDELIQGDQSAFAFPAYAIGLRKEWIFSQAMDTWPIQLNGASSWKVEQTASSTADQAALLQELFPDTANDNDQSAA
jgi:molybdopterin/thiamine biosynthesis adenylyltransferase